MSVEIAQATPEAQKPTVPQVEGTEGLMVARTDLTLTDANLSTFTRLVTKYARSQAYFLDEDPERVYRTTERLAAVVSDGADVWVMAPQLQVRSAKTHQRATVNQILARDLALEGMRLKAIKALADQGALPYLRAVGLSGGKDPDDAIDEHAARWERFLSGVRKAGKPEKLARSAQPSTTRSPSRLPVGELTIAGTSLTSVMRQHQETRHQKILYAATTTGTILSLLAASCSPPEASPAAPVTPSPVLSPTAGENPHPIPGATATLENLEPPKDQKTAGVASLFEGLTIPNPDVVGPLGITQEQFRAANPDVSVTLPTHLGIPQMELVEMFDGQGALRATGPVHSLLEIYFSLTTDKDGVTTGEWKGMKITEVSPFVFVNDHGDYYIALDSRGYAVLGEQNGQLVAGYTDGTGRLLEPTTPAFRPLAAWLRLAGYTGETPTITGHPTFEENNGTLTGRLRFTGTDGKTYLVPFILTGAVESRTTEVIPRPTEPPPTEIPVRVYTKEELITMAPTREEMVIFLKSDIIVRATNFSGTELPLGAGEIENDEFGSRRSTLEVIIWGKPVLADIPIEGQDQPIRSTVVPVIITGGKNNLDNPSFVYLVLGEEGKSGVGVSSHLGTNSEGAGSYKTVDVDVDTLSPFFVRGTQLKARVAVGFYDPAKEAEWRAMQDPVVQYAVFLIDTFGSLSKRALVTLQNGGTLEPGTLIGKTIEFIFINQH